MSRGFLIALCVVVAALQIGIWRAVELRNTPAQQMLQHGGRAPGKIVKASPELLDGRSRYLIVYEYQVAGREYQGEETMSLRQTGLPQAGQAAEVFYDTAHPDFSTLLDPRLTVHRLATMKLVILGFGAFTYAFVWVIWKSSANPPE